ncbi:MAG: polyphosphate kinase 1, partial [Proteobacteria bacterium]
EDETDDLLEMIAEELKQRRFAEVVRLEHGPKPDPWMLRFLMDELELAETEVFEVPSLLDYTELKPIADLPIAPLKYEPWIPLSPARLVEEGESIFSVIRDGDLMVHHPYESFGTSVEKFIRQSVDDPKVLAIKMTLYRTGDDSPFIPLLIRAAERGKQVVVLIELKARFDEERNIHWAQELENAGVHVVYGVIGLKTHAKVALVIRQDPDQIRSYAHFGTGNYHRDTAKLYTDVGLFTCSPSFTEDAVELFHFLTGRSLQRNYRKLLVAPINMKDQFLERIRREMEHAKAGKPARIIVKCNSLEDSTVGRALYDASRAGVKIELIVRGFCSLRPKVAGMSENIRVISIIGRFLEHSRIFFFQNGEADPLNGEFFIGSADWMYRNLLARVETVAPIEDKKLRERLWEIFEIMTTDRRQAWEMQADGSYIQYQPATKEEEVGTHKKFMALTVQRAEEAKKR